MGEAARRHVGERHLAGIGADVVGQLLHVAHRQAVTHQDGKRRLGHHRDRIEVTVGVVQRVLVDERVGDDEAGDAEQQRVAVGRGARRDLRRDAAGRARFAVDVEAWPSRSESASKTMREWVSVMPEVDGETTRTDLVGQSVDCAVATAGSSSAAAAISVLVSLCRMSCSPLQGQRFAVRLHIEHRANPQAARNRTAGITASTVALGETRLEVPAISARQGGPAILPTPFDACAKPTPRALSRTGKISAEYGAMLEKPPSKNNAAGVPKA
jgi:hypothetical protein